MNAAKKAIALAKKLHLPLLSMYVIDHSSFHKLFSSNNQYKMMTAESEEQAQKVLNEIEEISNKKNIKVNTMLVHGNPVQKIIKESQENDLIIMGAKGEQSLDTILLGSVSENVIHHSNSTVMIVK